jgi:2-polyprenyl-6-methoxyphenol hydroxylase-like FAD-dependent oxidoreductase
MIDCVVAGAGPAGLAASAALTARAVDHLVLERDRRDLALAAVGLVPAQHRGLDERAAGGAAAGRLPHRP